jgi:hypothetical protein
MTSGKRRPAVLWAILTASVLLSLSSKPALGLYGGMGFGWGIPMNQVPSPTGFIHQHALTRAGAGMQGAPSRTPYANSPNSYINRVRDNGFIPRYDVARRRPPTYRGSSTAAATSSRSDPQTSSAAAAASAIVPLSSFFDPTPRFLWPSDAPVAGELKEKRDVSDHAMLDVLQETRARNFASIASVATAREKLLDYGRPALKEVRTQATPAIAEAFHRFLLSIYDSLAQAASTP